MEAPKRVAIYGRVSTASQKERDLSVPEQLRQLREFCADKGWAVAGEYRDDGKSGASVEGRAQFKKMIGRAKSKDRPYDLILTRDLSRFGRGGPQDGVLREELRAHGVAVDNIDSPTGDMYGRFDSNAELMETIMGGVAKKARTENTSAMISGQKRLARLGGLPGSQGTGYGYMSEWVSEDGRKPRRLVTVDKVTSKVVRAMFTRYAKGASIKEVTRWLNKTGVTPPGHGQRPALEWYDTTVRAILKNESYLGRVVYGRLRRVRTANGTKKNMPGLTEPIRTDGAFPAIVTEELFAQVQERLQSRGLRQTTGPENPGNVLRGIGACKSCGWHMAHQRNSGNGRWYYMCGRCKMHKAPNVPRECIGIFYAADVDATVFEFLRQVERASPTLIRRAIDKHNEAASDFTGLDATALIDRAISETESLVENYAKSLGKRYSQAVQNLLEEAEDKLADLRRKRDDVASAITIPKADEKRIIDAHSSIGRVLRKGDMLQVRALLAELCSTIEVDLTKRTVRDPKAFSFRLERLAGPRLKSKEIREIEKRLKASPTMDALELALLDSRVSVNDIGPGPLRFVARWDLANVETATAEALERIGAAIS